MDIHFIHWLTFVGIFFMFAAAPGPDFLMVLRNSLIYSRKAGIYTALGVSLGTLTHVSYTLLGVAAVISGSVIIYNVIKWMGAIYLAYVGFRAIFSQGLDQKTVNSSLDEHKEKEVKSISSKQAFISGFLTDFLNPKAVLFFLAVFSQIINPETPLFWKLMSGISAPIISALWFTVFACFLTEQKIHRIFLRFSKWIDRACGIAFIGLGVKLALTAKN